MSEQDRQANPTPVLNNRSDDAKRALLDKYVRVQLAENAKQEASIGPRPSGEPAPISFNQQQVWLHAQMASDIPLYNEAITIYRQGPLDVAVLQRCLLEIVRRHEIWRSTFQVVGDEPVQVPHPAPDVFPLRVVDLRTLPRDKQQEEAIRLATEEVRRKFDITTGPLLRALLISTGDQQHRLYMTFHHLIFDAVTGYGVFLPELEALYEAFSAGKPSPLAEPRIQYADFAYWQRKKASSDIWSEDLEYWRQQFRGELPVCPWPSDRPRPPVQTHRGAVQRFAMPDSLSRKIRLLSRQAGVSVYMTLLAGLAAVLHRYTNESELVLGSLTAGRTRTELEHVMGYFVNPLAVRLDFSGNPSFRELQTRVRTALLEGLAHERVPFVQVVKEVQTKHDPSRNPLFQIILSQQPQVQHVAPGWEVVSDEISNGGSKLDLLIVIDDRGAAISGPITYNPDLFDAETIQRLVGHWQTLLEGACENPEAHITQLPILSRTERKKLLIEWNDTDASYPTDLCLHQLVTQQVERTPEAVAVAQGKRQWSYRELDQCSNRLAAYLQKRGVGPEVSVGLYVEPSCEMVVGILAALKAGGACLPLDPTCPKERLASMLDDARPAVLLTQQRLRSKLPASAVPIVCLDSDWSRISEESAQPLRSQCTPENLAYVIYTSGSTGKPKGVEITHGNLVHSTHARDIYYGAGAGRFLLLSSFAFDSSLAGIFGTLCQGGTLVLTPGLLQSNLPRLAEIIERQRISHLLAVPSLYSLLLEQARPGQLSTLRAAIVAGESCPSELVERHHRMLPNAALFNEYGPTEASVWSTVYKCEAPTTKPVSIGRPIPNVKVYVLDTHLNPMPIGIPGELHVGGPGVVRGYLGRAAETAERFIPDPFAEIPGSRLYKTGDRVRYRSDGNLELLGRLDHQLKIRGFRLDLEEIETVICQYEGAQQAIISVGEESNGEPKLVASVVARDPARFDTEQLKNFLSTKLPEVMLPSTYVLIEKLPLLPNGKVDRQAVAKLNLPTAAMQLSKPTSVIELILTQIWEAVLERPGIGVTENFFDLGGHSLLVTKLLLRIEQRFGKRLSLASVFQAPTIRQLAALLNGNGTSVHCGAVVPIQPRGSKPPLFLVRGGPLFLPLAKRLGLDQPVLGLDLPASDASRLPVPYKLEDIAGALIAHMREVQPSGPYHLAGLCVNGVIAYEMAIQLLAQGESVGLLVLFDAQNPAYYEDFSRESRSYILLRRIGYQLANLRRQKLPNFVRERLIGIHRRLSVRYWRIHHALGLPVDEEQLRDLDTIVHPASFVYRPAPYPKSAVFFQSTDWPEGRYWDFHASWNGLIGEGLQVIKIPGGHESMFHEENVDLLAGKLQDCLSAAMGPALSGEHVA